MLLQNGREQKDRRCKIETEVYLTMNIHEFGEENNEIILLIHPSVVKWDYFENVIPLLQEKFHLLIPAIITKYLSMFRIWTRKFIIGVQKMRKKSENRILHI